MRSPFSTLKNQFHETNWPFLNLKRHVKVFDTIGSTFKKHSPKSFGHFLNLIRQWTQNIYAISTLKRHKSNPFGVFSTLKKVRSQLEIPFLNLIGVKFLKFTDGSNLIRGTQKKIILFEALDLSWNWINMQSPPPRFLTWGYWLSVSNAYALANNLSCLVRIKESGFR